MVNNLLYLVESKPDILERGKSQDSLSSVVLDFPDF